MRADEPHRCAQHMNAQPDCVACELAAERNANAALLTALREAKRENRILEMKNAGTLANNLCPDHRDKQQGRPCLACLLETAERKREQLEKRGPGSMPLETEEK